MESNLILPFLTAFGLGSIVTAGVQYWLKSRSDHKDKVYLERREAYIGLLEAYHRAAIEGTENAAKNFAYWQMRCEIVAPEPVRMAIEEIVASNDDLEWRNQAHEKLKSAMRCDLQITN